MLHNFEPVAKPAVANRWGHNPVLPVVIAMACGILVDRSVSPNLVAWLLVAWFVVVLTIVGWATRRWRVSAAVLLVGCVGLGGAWHHWRWNCLATDDLSNWATERGRIVRLVARVLSTPQLITSNESRDAPWRSPDRTTAVVECRELLNGEMPSIQVAGHARLSIAGRLEGLSIGDVIEVTGELVRPAEPSNPGDFDARAWLRAQGLHSIVATDFPAAVRVVGRERSLVDWILVMRASARQRAENLIASNLSPRTAAVAQSLLLGSRVELDRDLRRAFAESGTLHVLAISGMNVGLLWSWLWLLCRVFRRSARTSLIAVLALLPAYTLLTDANPPVVRATIVAVVLAFGQLVGRNSSMWNSLALAALFVLIGNPTDLFNSGAQLSFLAVFAILLMMGFLRSLRGSFELDEGSISGSLWRSAVSSFMRLVVEGYLVTAAIWVLTSPLIASQFHLVSPIGFVLNVLLSPLIVVMFWLGYSFLLLGMLSPLAFGWLGVPFDLVLRAFLSAVENAARLDFGHVYAPSPPVWWMAGFYVLALSLALVDSRRGKLFLAPRAVLAWTVFGLAVTLRSSSTSELNCTVLSVGHGLSVLVECPNGRTLLYDAGGMSGGTRTARTIEAALWSSGHSRLDAIVVSHADSDHCNALPELVEVIPTRSLLVHRTFLDWTQPPVAEAIERSAVAGVTIELLSAGQSVRLDPNVSLRVLHPANDFLGASDNANSIVVCLEYAGRRIVLTGDLERGGLFRLLQTERMDADVLLSPHHGSHRANPTDLARWATPEWLIASCRDNAVSDRLAANFGPATRVLTTARHGAIRCRIRADGDLSVEPFRRFERPE